VHLRRNTRPAVPRHSGPQARISTVSLDFSDLSTIAIIDCLGLAQLQVCFTFLTCPVLALNGMSKRSRPTKSI
jgi:hypothetical protein